MGSRATAQDDSHYEIDDDDDDSGNINDSRIKNQTVMPLMNTVTVLSNPV